MKQGARRAGRMDGENGWQQGEVPKPQERLQAEERDKNREKDKARDYAKAGENSSKKRHKQEVT